MPTHVNGFSLGYTAFGAVVLWSGIRGWSISETFHNLLSGKTPGSNTQPITGAGQSAASSDLAASVSDSLLGTFGAVPKGGTPTKNKAIGALLASGYGWGPGSKDWPYLESGWQEESGWSQVAAYNHSDPYNNAYGIPQANPGTKMASAGKDWQTSAATQIRWGLKYIRDTYGAPSKVPGWTPNGPAAGYVGY